MKDTDSIISEIQSLERKSKRTLPFTLIGLTAVMISLYYSASILMSLRNELDKESANLARVRVETQNLEAELADSRARITESNSQLTSLKSKLVETSSELEKANTQASELASSINELKNEKEALEHEVGNLVADQQKLQTQVEALKGRIADVTPSTVTIVTANESQNAKANGLKALFEGQGAQVRIVPQKKGAFVPYATEVRYFNYPADLELAQAVVMKLQKDFGIILSRISYVKDERAQRTIDIYFNDQKFE